MATDKELAEIRRDIEIELANVQDKIFQLESNYLEETITYGNSAITVGNVVRGWEWSGSRMASKANTSKKIALHDRIFSLSSETSDVIQKTQNDGGTVC